MAIKTGHRAASKGKKVGVKLRDGSIVYGKFYEKKGKWIWLIDDEGNKIKVQGIRLLILKNGRSEEKKAKNVITVPQQIKNYKK